MKAKNIIFVLTGTLLLSTAGYAADNEQQESHDCAMEMGASETKPGTGNALHDGHMMHSAVSPVTINIQPGTMPMWGNMYKQHGEDRHSKKLHHNKGMRQSMRKEHMEQVEQRLKNIEALLAELVELKRNE
jgi:hypothetical protein